MSDISKTGVVIRIPKETSDILAILKKMTGISKYKITAIAVQQFYDQNQKMIEELSLLKSKSQVIQKIFNDNIK
mgnify:CR=1 FL=1